MINIYTSEKEIPQGLFNKAIKRNDIFFNGIKDRIQNIDDTMKKIIKKIDGSEYISGTTIKTRFNEYLDMKYLSTGCKTALNVYLNPNQLVYCIEAGTNAQEVILRLSKGNILVPIVPSILNDFRVDAVLFMNGEKQAFTKSSDLMEAWING